MCRVPQYEYAQSAVLSLLALRLLKFHPSSTVSVTAVHGFTLGLHTQRAGSDSDLRVLSRPPPPFPLAVARRRVNTHMRLRVYFAYTLTRK